MRGTWKRIVAAVGLAAAVLVPTSAGAAQTTEQPELLQASIPPPAVQECATALRIAGRRIASCGMTFDGRGRIGTYDSAVGGITWGPWQGVYNLPIPRQVTGTDGRVGRFLGYPVVSNRFGWAAVHGTQYIRTADGSFLGRRGVYTFTTGRFEPYGSDWHPTVGCVEFEPCPGLWYEPIPKRT